MSDEPTSADHDPEDATDIEDDAADDGALPPLEPVDREVALELLEHGEMDVEGRMPWSSNATFLVHLHGDAGTVRAIYKPARGERPLWDFPEGLYRREVAAYELAKWLGWDMIPPTVGRDGDFGVGSVQLFVDADFEQHHFTLVEDEVHHPQLRRMCAFDLLANNTDRKSGHCLIDHDGHIWGIDQGLCFSPDWKLRTVIWEFGGEPIDEELLADVCRLAEEGVPESLQELLSRDETAALWHRAMDWADRGVFPIDATGRRYPWPLV